LCHAPPEAIHSTIAINALPSTNTKAPTTL
jgi:hypothetical protein